MDIKESMSGSTHFMEVNGRLDTVTAPEFQEKLMGKIGDGNIKILIHCAGLSYISSSGLRVFLMALKKIKAGGGQMVLCCLQDSIREVFDISGFSALFTLTDNCEEGLSKI
jgi:anti-sigma B factor antagonist